jgi:hypothetical protein
MAIEFSGALSSSARAAGLRREKLENASQERITIKRPSSTAITFATFALILSGSFPLSVDDKRQLLFES